MRPSNRSSLELRAEHVKYVGNVAHEFIDRLSDQTPIGEAYLKGNLTLHMHGWIESRPYCLNAFRPIEGQDHRGVWDGNSEEFVLVRVGNVPQGARPIATLKRLQPADHCLVWFLDPAQASVSAGIPTLGPLFDLLRLMWLVFDRKLRLLLDLARVENGESIDEVIEGTPEVVHNLADKDREVGWRPALSGNVLEPATTVWWNTNGIACLTPEGAYMPFEVKTAFLAPSYSRIRIIEGWHAALGL